MRPLKLILLLSLLTAALTVGARAQAKRPGDLRSKTNADSPIQFQELRCRGGAIAQNAAVTDLNDTYDERNYTVNPVSEMGSQKPPDIARALRIVYTTTALIPTAEVMYVEYRPGRKPVGDSGRNLRPGECGWVDRDFRPGERGPIAQQNSRQDAQKIFEYLKDPNHYWSFFVVKTGNKGDEYFEAATSRAWNPQPIPFSSKARSSGKVNGADADELNPQPLPPCERCPENQKKPVEQKKPLG